MDTSRYVLIGAVMWVALLKSGEHATLDGVLLALFIPMKDPNNPDRSPLMELEHNLHTSVAFGVGKAISFELYGRDFDELRSVAAELRVALQGYEGVLDVTDTFRAGKQEVQLSLLPGARNLGLTLDDLGQQIRQAFYGYEAQRIQRGKDDVRVMVRFPGDERRSLGDLEAMQFTLCHVETGASAEYAT